MKLSKRILKAINEGVYRALADLDDDEDIVLTKSSIDLSKADKRYKKINWFEEHTVDMGLPSGKLWAKYNLGATCKDTAGSWYGDYYAWGETEPKDIYNWSSYKFGDWISKYNKNDKLMQLFPEDDAACCILKLGFYIPSQDDYEELIDHVTFEEVENYNNIKNLNGIVAISNVNGNELFFPYAGCEGVYGSNHLKTAEYTYYTTSTRCEQNEYTYISFFSPYTYQHPFSAVGRYAGSVIRPIKNSLIEI